MKAKPPVAWPAGKPFARFVGLKSGGYFSRTFTYGFVPPYRCTCLGVYTFVNCLLPAIKYFVEGLHPLTNRLFREEAASQGVFVFVIDGTVDDFELVRDYCLWLAEEIKQKRRTPVKLIAAGFGDRFLEDSQGQMQALHAQMFRRQPDVFAAITALTIEDIPAVVGQEVMATVPVGHTGMIRDVDGRVVQSFSDAVPAAFEFYLSPHSRSFSVSIDGRVYPYRLGPEVEVRS